MGFHKIRNKERKWLTFYDVPNYTMIKRSWGSVIISLNYHGEICIIEKLLIIPAVAPDSTLPKSTAYRQGGARPGSYAPRFTSGLC